MSLMNNYASVKSGCKCCPYGYHIDLDFVEYCDTLLSAWYGKSGRTQRTNSLNNGTEEWLKTNNQRNKECDLSLNDAVAKFEEALSDRDGRGRLGECNNKLDGLNGHRLSGHKEAFKDSSKSEKLRVTQGLYSKFNEQISRKFNENTRKLKVEAKLNDDKQNESSLTESFNRNVESEGASPSPVPLGYSNQARLVLSVIRDQLAISLERMRELEQQVKTIPMLRQEVMVLRQGAENEYDTRVEELERSGIITPPVRRRVRYKNYRKGNSIFESSISRKKVDNIVDKKKTSNELFVLNDEIKPFCDSCINDIKNGSTRSKKLLTWSRGTNPRKVQIREAGVQVNPNLRSKCVSTVKIDTKEIGMMWERQGSLPGRFIQTEAIRNEEKGIQVTGRCADCELKEREPVEVVTACVQVDVGMNTEEIDTVLSHKNDNLKDSKIRVNGKCSDFQNVNKIHNEYIYDEGKKNDGVVKDSKPNSRTSSVQSIQNEDIKDVKSPSKIPRFNTFGSPSLSSSTGSTIINVSTGTSAVNISASNGFTTNVPSVSKVSDIIIEESNNEIFVYRNPNPSALSISRKNRSDYTSMMTPRVNLEGIRLMDEACKITDSDSESVSSNDGPHVELNQNPLELKRSQPSKELKAALKVLNDSLLKSDRANKPATAKSLQIIEREWFPISSNCFSDPMVVESYLDCLEKYSKHLLNKVVNLSDNSGNTAMHYAISHANFGVVSVLLDSKVCDVNKQNKLGYTAIMLASVASIINDTQKAVIKRLLSLGDVNIRAKQNGQTALMLASSHGQLETCRLLLAAAAAVNVRDNDGSTALMCATEHGHIDVVKLLLSHAECDPTIEDNDHSTALSIAIESGRKDIATLLSASSNRLTRSSSPYASLRRTHNKTNPVQLRRTGSFITKNATSTKTAHSAPSPPVRNKQAPNKKRGPDTTGTAFN